MATREPQGGDRRAAVEAPRPTAETTRPGDLELNVIAPDPWKHRSRGMRCRTCMWYVTKERYHPPTDTKTEGKLGRCRRHAPTMNGYPAVFPSDWCGDHKLDETKVAE